MDGIIVLQPPVALRAFAGQLRALRGFGQRPILSLVWPVEDCASIVTDNAGGTYQAAQHLLAQGHRHLLQFVTEFSDIYDAGYVVHTRLAGLTRALEEAGVDPASHLHPMLLPSNWQDPANLLLETYRWSPSNLEDVAAHPLVSYLREHPEITAVFGCNDACAIRACFLLRAAGLRVPEDISIVGFDDTDPLPGPEGANLLSSVHLPLYEMGRLAAQTIIRLVTAKTWQPEQLMLPTEFIPRASIAPAKTK